MSIGASVVIYNAESNNIYVLSSVVVFSFFTKCILLEMHICFMVDTKSIKEVCTCVVHMYFYIFGEFDAFCAYVFLQFRSLSVFFFFFFFFLKILVCFHLFCFIYLTKLIYSSSKHPVIHVHN